MNVWTRIFGRTEGKLTDPNLRLMFSEGTHAGKEVTVDSMLQLSTAWACVRLLSETIGTLPVTVNRRVGDDMVSAREHPLYSLLHDSPNGDQTAAEFWEGMVAALCLVGNGYARKHLNGVGTLIALEPLVGGCEPFRDRNGARRYRVAGVPGDLGEDEIFHLRGFGVGGLQGLSPVSYARQTMAAATAAEETAAKTFANGLQLSGFIEMTGSAKITAPQRQELVDLFAKFAGSGQAGKVMPLDPGMKFVALGMNPEDAQLLETRSFHVEEICRWFRVPPFMIGHTEKTTSWGTGLEQQMIGFLTFSLRPYLTRIEQAVKKQLMTPAERASLSVEFNLEGLLRADSAGRAALYSQFAQNGIATRNEIRRRENLPRKDGADGLTVQSNLLPIDKLGTVQAVTPPNAKES